MAAVVQTTAESLSPKQIVSDLFLYARIDPSRGEWTSKGFSRLEYWVDKCLYDSMPILHKLRDIWTVDGDVALQIVQRFEVKHAPNEPEPIHNTCHLFVSELERELHSAYQHVLRLQEENEDIVGVKNLIQQMLFLSASAHNSADGDPLSVVYGNMVHTAIICPSVRALWSKLLKKGKQGYFSSIDLTELRQVVETCFGVPRFSLGHRWKQQRETCKEMQKLFQPFVPEFASQHTRSRLGFEDATRRMQVLHMRRHMRLVDRAVRSAGISRDNEHIIKENLLSEIHVCPGDLEQILEDIVCSFEESDLPYDSSLSRMYFAGLLSGFFRGRIGPLPSAYDGCQRVLKNLRNVWRKVQKEIASHSRSVTETAATNE
jgi:hypothetical protein